MQHITKDLVKKIKIKHVKSSMPMLQLFEMSNSIKVSKGDMINVNNYILYVLYAVERNDGVHEGIGKVISEDEAKVAWEEYKQTSQLRLI